MSKQWVVVGGIVLGLIVGAVALAMHGAPEGAEPGKRAPNFRALDLATGDSVALRPRYDGTVTLVNIWATWCVPCRTEMPAMQQAYAALKNKGFRIVAVSVDEGSAADVKRFVQEYGLTFDVLQDQSGRIQQTYRTTGVPESFLLDKSGVIVKRVIGAHDWNSPANRSQIERLLAAGS